MLKDFRDVLPIGETPLLRKRDMESESESADEEDDIPSEEECSINAMEGIS
jgi:hypothetical protein